MRAEYLLDKDGVYTYSDDIIYSEEGKPYHVNYYQQYGVLHIVLDNTESFNDFKVVYDLSAYSHKKPVKQEEEVIYNTSYHANKEEEVANNHSYTTSHVVDNKSEYTTNSKEILAINEKVTVIDEDEKDNSFFKTSLFYNIDFNMTVDVDDYILLTWVFLAASVIVLVHSLCILKPTRENLAETLSDESLWDEATLDSSEITTVDYYKNIKQTEEFSYFAAFMFLIIAAMVWIYNNLDLGLD